MGSTPTFGTSKINNMIKIIIFDTDGVLIHHEMYFSQRFSKEFGIPMDDVLQFFKNEFQLCLVGKADLKEELAKYFPKWKWERTVDELLAFWFENENNVDKRILENVTSLRKNGIRCYLDTNNEKYRVKYLFEDMGLKNYFDGSFSSAELGYLKPQQEFWAMIHEHLGHPDKKNVLVWDDDEKNVESAKFFGFNSEFYSTFDGYKKVMKSLFHAS